MSTDDIEEGKRKLTCKQMHRLVSEGLDRELSLVERSRMHLHLAVCEACRRFDRQMDFLRRAMRTLPPSDSTS
jgi:predicted anti-sigma-YlaC factor YlaD